jgi:hypothetical protein
MNSYRKTFKPVENSMGTDEVYLEMLDMCPISYSPNLKAIFKFFT